MHLSAQDIRFWSDAMSNANHYENRVIASEKFLNEFHSILESESPFNYDFKSIPELTVLEDSLQSFKLVTWQVQKGEEEFEYHGYIIKKNQKVIPLSDAYDQLSDLDYLVCDPDSWIGGIYYDIIEAGNSYYVFSYRQNNKFEKFKSFDILYFDEKDQPVFGKEKFVFESDGVRPRIQNRVTFKYSADAILSLNYNKDMQMVVHDHLMQVIGRLPEQGPTFVPDGTYEGFVFEEGKWIYKEKLFDHTYDEAPRPVPILDAREKNIFGKEKKN